MNGNVENTGVPSGTISQMDDGAKADTFADVFVMKAGEKTYTITEMSENSYSGYEGQPSGIKALFRHENRDNAIAFAKEWVVNNYDDIKDINGDPDFINEVFRDETSIKVEIEIPSELAEKKGLIGDEKKISVIMGRMAWAYYENRVGKPTYYNIEEGMERVKTLDFSQRYVDSHIWGAIWGEKIMEKLPFGKRRMTLTIRELSEMRRKFEKIYNEWQEKTKEEREKEVEEWKKRAEETLKEIKEEYPEISWTFTDHNTIIVATNGDGVILHLDDSSDGIEEYHPKRDIKMATAKYKREVEKIKKEAEQDIREFARKYNAEDRIKRIEISVDKDRMDKIYVKLNGTSYGDIRDSPRLAEILGVKHLYLMEEIERKIVERKKALEIAEKNGLENQVEKHREYIEFYERKKAVYEAGYSETLEWDSDEYERTDIEDYDATIPVSCMEAYQKAVESGVFDRFEVWDEYDDYDPILVGVVEVNKKRAYFEICRW